MDENFRREGTRENLDIRFISHELKDEEKSREKQKKRRGNKKFDGDWDRTAAVPIFHL